MLIVGIDDLIYTPACSIVIASEFGLLLLLMAILDGINYSGDYLPYSVVTCLVCLALFRVNVSILAKFFPKVKDLSSFDKICLSERVSSIYHTILVLPICFYAFFIVELNQHPVWWDSAVVRTNCAIVAGFILSDTILIVIHFKQQGGLLYIVHHISTIGAYYIIMSYGICGYFANFRLLAEISTPFVHLRWFYDKMGYSRRRIIFVIIAVMMTGTFFVFRVLVIPMYWYTVYRAHDSLKIGSFKYILIVCSLVLDILNVYWFVRMCEGVKRGLCKEIRRNVKVH